MQSSNAFNGPRFPAFQGTPWSMTRDQEADDIMFSLGITKDHVWFETKKQEVGIPSSYSQTYDDVKLVWPVPQEEDRPDLAARECLIENNLQATCWTLVHDCRKGFELFHDAVHETYRTKFRAGKFEKEIEEAFNTVNASKGTPSADDVRKTADTLRNLVEQIHLNILARQRQNEVGLFESCLQNILENVVKQRTIGSGHPSGTDPDDYDLYQQLIGRKSMNEKLFVLPGLADLPIECLDMARLADVRDICQNIIDTDPEFLDVFDALLGRS